MNTKKLVALFCFFCCGIAFFAQNPEAVNVFLGKKTLSHATISMKVVELASGNTIASYNEAVALTPASNMKLITTATVLSVLGEQFQFETPLIYDGFVEDSILKGDLYVKGSGDPTLGSEFTGDGKEAFLKSWLADIHKAGIKSISGDLIVLDQLYGYEGVSPKWLLEDLGTYYAAGTYGISVFDNLCRIYLRSFDPGSATEILYTKPSMDLSFSNELSVSETATSDDSFVFGFPFVWERRLYGNLPPNRSAFVLKGDIPDPGLFFARYFCTYLQNNGIEVKGKASAYRLHPKMPVQEKLLGAVRSPVLSDIVRDINVRSNNHYTEHLYKLLTLEKAVDIPAYWAEKGLDTLALIMYDGSGLSPQNAISAGFLCDLLAYMNEKYGNAGAFYQSLPIAGKEGTVASLLKDTSLVGKVRLKSGSMSHVQSYSGYVEKGDRRYAISLIINGFKCKRADLRKDIEQLLIDLF
jgi:D-alanyl-D-alanine carboxypeptidase/D-alanyl-D-alanine-endopeptidase (penicillin-binding protein 4)